MDISITHQDSRRVLMKANKKTTITAILALIMLTMVIGCGDDYTDFTHNAPADAKISFLQGDITFSNMPSTPGLITPVHLIVRVTDANDVPMNGIKLIIYGSLAYPWGDPDILYYFSDSTHGKLASGFTGVTGEGGAYNFTVNIPSTRGTNTNSFFDDIYATSGAAAPAKVKITYN